ncbi:MAG: hypothetical protein P8M30_02745 [Planctomycetaceae bacterium]|nr:hypothetical protein [Planctomycetaceae bacterium]
MSTVEVTLKWLEKAGDWMNAILVKETRQSLKSRQFVASFLLLVFASWVISVFGVAMMGDSINYGASGQRLFVFYFVVLMIAVTVIVPYGAFRSMLGEKDQNTFDSLRITSLSPWQIVWGKLLSALLQDFIYYSAIAPFIAFTSLLEGFELAAVAFVLFCGFLISVALSIMALMVSTFAHQRHWQGILSIMLLIGLLTVLGQSSTVLLSMFSDSSLLQSWEFWQGTAIVVLIGLSYCWLFLEITSAQLTFESGNRSSGIRLITSGQLLMMNGLALGMSLFYGGAMGDDLFLSLAIFSYVQLTAISFVATTEEDFLSRRIRKSLPQRKLFRFLFAPFLPGGARGMVYLLMTLGLCFGLNFLTLSSISASGGMSSGTVFEITRSFLGVALYIIIYLGFASMFGRFASRTGANIRPNHVRVITVLLFAIGCVIPMIAKAMEFLRWREYSLLEIINPFATIIELAESNSWTGPILLILGVFALIAVLLNLKAMIFSIHEIVAIKAAPQDTTVTIKPFQLPEDSPSDPLVEG